MALLQTLLARAQFSVSCEMPDVGQNGHTEATAFCTKVSSKALGQISTLAALLFVCSSPAGPGGCAVAGPPTDTATTELLDAGSSAVAHQILLPCMSTCAGYMSVQLRQQVAAACIEGYLSVSDAQNQAPPPQLVQSTDLSLIHI